MPNHNNNTGHYLMVLIFPAIINSIQDTLDRNCPNKYKHTHTLLSFPVLSCCWQTLGGGGAADTFKDHCNKTVDIYVDVASPEVTLQNRGQPLTCWYRFRSFRGAPRDWVLRLKFNKFKVGNLVNATHCEGGYLQVSISEAIE